MSDETISIYDLGSGATGILEAQIAQLRAERDAAIADNAALLQTASDWDALNARAFADRYGEHDTISLAMYEADHPGAALLLAIARKDAALNKTYGALSGHGVAGLMERAAEILELYAGVAARSIIAEDLRTAMADISTVTGSLCEECGQPAPLLTIKRGGMDTGTKVCKPCARAWWAGSARRVREAK